MAGRGATTVPFTTKLTDFDDALIKRDICTREQCLLAKGMDEEQVLDLLVHEDVTREMAKLDEAAREAEAEVARDPLRHATAHATRDELDDLDEDDEFLDDAFLAKYREARIAELTEASKQDRFGSVFEIEKADWTREVNEVSNACWVFVHLYQDYVADSAALNVCLESLAKTYPHVKFVKIRATSAVEKWPDSNLPAVYLYHEGEMQHQLIGSRAISEGPPPFTANSVARKLATFKIVDEHARLPDAPPPPPPASDGGTAAKVRRSAYSREDDATWDA